ncbi:MAG: hypothetical protein ABIS47_10095 [Acidimicrobiales bacterium]
MRRWLVTLLLVVGCTRPSGGTPAATTTTLLPPEPTTAAAPTSTTSAEFARPEVIDLPYVQRVLEAIYHLDGEATRHAYATKALDTELDERLDAIFGDPRLAAAKQVLKEEATDGFERFADPPADAHVRAVELIQSKPTCMVLRADLDYGPQYKEYRPPQPQAVIQLLTVKVMPYNPTGWGIVAAGAVPPDKNLKVCT